MEVKDVNDEQWFQIITQNLLLTET